MKYENLKISLVSSMKFFLEKTFYKISWFRLHKGMILTEINFIRENIDHLKPTNRKRKPLELPTENVVCKNDEK